MLDISRCMSEIPVVYLKSGGMYFSEYPALVTTVLGSCLSVTMFDSCTRLGAICHCLLPRCEDLATCDGTCRDACKYVDCSIKKMLGLFSAYGVRRGELEVKLFGGADMSGTGIVQRGGLSIGRQNIEAALQCMRSERLAVRASDVGGDAGRKLFFYTHTSHVLLKRLDSRTGGLPAPGHANSGAIPDGGRNHYVCCNTLKGA